MFIDEQMVVCVCVCVCVCVSSRGIYSYCRCDILCKIPENKYCWMKEVLEHSLTSP